LTAFGGGVVTQAHYLVRELDRRLPFLAWHSRIVRVRADASAHRQPSYPSLHANTPLPPMRGSRCGGRVALRRAWGKAPAWERRVPTPGALSELGLEDDQPPGQASRDCLRPVRPAPYGNRPFTGRPHRPPRSWRRLHAGQSESGARELQRTAGRQVREQAADQVGGQNFKRSRTAFEAWANPTGLFAVHSALCAARATCRIFGWTEPPELDAQMVALGEARSQEAR
jgi:hypothetical protein